MSSKGPRIINYYDGDENFVKASDGLFEAEGEVGLIIDLETTGLQAGKDKIIEIGLVQFRYDKETGAILSIIAREDFLQDPEMPLPQIIKDLTGLTDEMLKGQKINRKRVETLCKESGVIIAHNAAFDRGFMHNEFPASDQCFWACSKDDIDWKAHGFSCRVLQHLCNDHEFYFDGHRAEIDCMSLLKLISMKNKNTTYLKELINAAFLKEYVLFADGAPFESKDILKNAYFRWDATNKVWSKKIKENNLEEMKELMKTVYKKGRVDYRLVEISSKKRFLD